MGGKRKMRVEDCLDDNGKPDLFEPDEGYYHIPCGMCAKRREAAESCRGCRHYVE
ncbi:hypothetical protein CCP3SC15_360028 [Gammaproteobacteria bacterium]